MYNERTSGWWEATALDSLIFQCYLPPKFSRVYLTFHHSFGVLSRFCLILPLGMGKGEGEVRLADMVDIISTDTLQFVFHFIDTLKEPGAGAGAGAGQGEKVGAGVAAGEGIGLGVGPGVEAGARAGTGTGTRTGTGTGTGVV